MIEFPFRRVHDLNHGWSFKRNRVSRRWLAGHGAEDKTVTLPHCWNTQDTYQFGRRAYSGHGAYRLSFRAPHPDESNSESFWRLISDGFYGTGDLWLDGMKVSTIDGQYLGFRHNIDRPLHDSDHLLALRLDNRYHRNVLPGASAPDFILHGGLAGCMRLQSVPVLHFEPDETTVRCTRSSDGSEVIALSTLVKNHSQSRKSGGIKWTITDSDGTPITQSPSIQFDLEPRGNSNTLATSVRVSSPKFWSPEEPALYWAEGRMTTSVGAVDLIRIRFGITRAEFRPNQGFFLNDRRVDLHGCNRHEAIPGLGNALPDELHRDDAKILKDLGSNFVRLSHYPQSPTFLDACDELGILVYAEIASWKSVRSARGWRRAARRQMRDMIVRDRHHPCIILWGMGNESRSRKAYLELRDIAHQIDPGRPVTYAENHLYRARRKKTTGLPDVWGVNYELEVLEQARNVCRLQNIVLSECCNHPTSVKGDDCEELTQVAVLEREWEIMADRPYLAGHAVWSFADYATEYRKRIRRHTGLFDAWRRPKMAAELFRARYSDAPFISLFPTTIEGSGQLHIFSNCNQIRIFRDDVRAIVLGGAHHHVVDLIPGFTRIRVEGERGGRVVSKTLAAWEEAAALSVGIPEGPILTGITLPLEILVRDHHGSRVQNWNGCATVSAEGDGRVLCFTGSNEVLLARGEGRTYLQVGSSGTPITITAAVENLDPGTATIIPVDAKD